MNAVRKLPQGSALDASWGWMEQHHLTENSIILPSVDLCNEDKITQTAVRLFFVLLLPLIAKPFGYANLGLGATHLIWCVVNIRKIRAKQDGCSSQDIEKALIRLFTGVYDLAIAYLLCSPFMSSIYGRFTIPIIFALLPTYAIQLHHLIFEKASKQIEQAGQQGQEKKFTLEVDHKVLKVGCLIKQFCNGLVEAFLPEPTPIPRGYLETAKHRATAIPFALGTFFTVSYRNLRGIKEEGTLK
jgi:hypothetical protein